MGILGNMGKMDDFEISNSKLILFLMAPGLWIYSMIIGIVHVDRIEVPYGREVFSMLFFLVVIIPSLNKQWSRKNYAHVVFSSLLLFAHYLIYTLSLNAFGLDYLLGTYIVLFGGILLQTNRMYVIVFTLTTFVHMALGLWLGDIPASVHSPILLSLATIFLFSFFIQNGFLRYKLELKKANLGLKSEVEQRNLDLEKRAKELAHKNRDLEEFAFVVSHDMKRPLRNVHSLAAWVKDDLKKGSLASAGDNLTLLMDQVAQMDVLIDGILQYSLGVDNKKVTRLLDLNTLVDTMVQANSGNNIHIIKDSALPRLLVDKAQILQVFQNLVQNAIKYNDKPEVLIHIGVIDEVDRFKFYVSDNGEGISTEHFDRIFKLFQKLNTRPVQDSSGIGLAVVQKIIGKMGGEIWVESELGEGSTFYFSLYKRDVINGFEAGKVCEPALALN